MPINMQSPATLKPNYCQICWMYKHEFREIKQTQLIPSRLHHLQLLPVLVTSPMPALTPSEVGNLYRKWNCYVPGKGKQHSVFVRTLGMCGFTSEGVGYCLQDAVLLHYNMVKYSQ